MSSSPQAAHPTDVEREVKRQQALTMRIARATYRQIATALSVSVGTAHSLVTEALAEVRETNTETTAELKAQESLLLDRLTLQLLPAPDAAGKTPKLDARTVDTILRLRERFHKLHGLDAPTKWEGSGPGGGPFPIGAQVLDVSKLSVEQLAQLERFYQTAGAAARPLPAGEVTDHPPASTNGKEPR